MKISVIIPTYKPSTYLWECLESLCQQTIDHQLYEIVIVLNGSDEPYATMIRQFIDTQGEHTNIRLFQTDIASVSHARNIGIEESVGDYITFVDDDDWVSKAYLEELVKNIDDGTVVEANVIQYDEKGKVVADNFLSQAYRKVSKAEKITLFKSRSFFSSACCKMIPRYVIGNIRFDVKFSLGEDSLFMFAISKNVRRVKTSRPDAVYHIRTRSNSASHSHYSYGFRAKVIFRLTKEYVKIYITDMRRYNFLFFLTRIAATLRKLFLKNYQ